MTVLSDRGIEAALEEGLWIEPWHNAAVQPASFDLTLGRSLLVWPMGTLRDPRYGRQEDAWQSVGFRDVPDGPIWILEPGRRYLATTAEHVRLPDTLAGQISARSSWGRDGLDVIQGPAGWIDPGYRGRPTLELSVTGSSLVIWPGAPCLQLVLYRLDRPCARPYAGRYQGDLEPTPAREPVQ